MRLETKQPRFSMFERINQALRHIQRQHKSKAIGAGTAFGGSALAAGLLGAGIVTGPASIVFLVPVYAGVMMGALGGDPSRVRDNEYTLNGFKLVGTPRDLTRILSTGISPMSRRFCSVCVFTNPMHGKKKKKASCHRSNSNVASSTKKAAKQNRCWRVSNWCRWGFCRGRNLRVW